MPHQRDPKGGSSSILGLDERDDLRPDIDDVPLKLTEERYRAERERTPQGGRLDGFSLGSPPPVERPLLHSSLQQPEPGTATNIPAQTAPSKPAVGLLDEPLIEASPAEPSARIATAPALTSAPPLIRQYVPVHSAPSLPKVRRRGRGLWAAVVFLTLALIAVTSYGYLVVRQNHISTAELPGAPALDQIRVEVTTAARGADQRVQATFWGMYQRYEQWRHK